MLIYLVKTFGGDYFAGKLDTKEWKLVLLFVFGFLSPAVYFLNSDSYGLVSKHARITFVLFVIQLFCEFGDNRLEHWTFFRHRYSYEVANLLVLFALPNPQPHETAVIQLDLFICLFYRISNFVIILARTDKLYTILKYLIFKVHGWLIGVTVMNVTDPRIATAVMKRSSDKGLALER
jgi:hypothetical protein